MSSTGLSGRARRDERRAQAVARKGGGCPAKKAGLSEGWRLRQLEDAVAALTAATDQLAVALRRDGGGLPSGEVVEARKRLAAALGAAKKLDSCKAVELRKKAEQAFLRSHRLLGIARGRREAFAVRKAAKANGNGSRSCASQIPTPSASGRWEFGDEVALVAAGVDGSVHVG